MLVLFLLSSVTVVFGATLTSSSNGGPLPWFCHNQDCPRYTMERNLTTYEVRLYEPTMWVATNASSTELETVNLFNRLFGYISGKNSRGEKVPMTSPVVTKIIPGPLPSAKITEIMHFMVPHNMTNTAPAPTDPLVYLVHVPALRVYVKSFGGYARGHANIMHIAELARELGGPAMFDSSHYYTAGYDGPYTIANRHNEVWIPVSRA